MPQYSIEMLLLSYLILYTPYILNILSPLMPMPIPSPVMIARATTPHTDYSIAALVNRAMIPHYISETVQGSIRVNVNVNNKYEVICNLSNSFIFNNLE